MRRLSGVCTSSLQICHWGVCTPPPITPTGTPHYSTALATSIALLFKNAPPINDSTTLTMDEFVVVEPKIFPITLVKVWMRIVLVMFLNILVICLTKSIKVELVVKLPPQSATRHSTI